MAIVGSDLRALVGGRGETLDALQELTRLAVQQQDGVSRFVTGDALGPQSLHGSCERSC